MSLQWLNIANKYYKELLKTHSSPVENWPDYAMERPGEKKKRGDITDLPILFLSMILFK